MIVFVARIILKIFYRVKVRGLENYHKSSKRTLIVANHTSFLDAALLVCFLPGDFSFAIHTRIVNQWFMAPFRRIVKLFVMDPIKPFSLKSLIRYLEKGNKVVIFPEGRITMTGSLMKIYNGPGLVADRSCADVLPVRINGGQYTPFSRLRGKVRLRWFPKISLTILPPRKLKAPEHVRGRARRKYVGKLLTNIMHEMIFATSDYRCTLFQAIIDAKKIYGGKHKIADDIDRVPINYRQMVQRCFILGDALAKQTQQGEIVGVLLPNMVNTVITFFAFQTHGRVPAMLNFSSGAKAICIACETAQIKTVFTSRRFEQLVKLEDTINQIRKISNVIYLEDVVEQISPFKKISSLVTVRFAKSAYIKRVGKCDPDQPAVVLFTSGSEGTAKAVVLSHSNLLANGIQLATRVDFNSQDIILNVLPLFHSFGLTAATLIPLVFGMQIFLYPNPLHYRIIPEVAYDIGASIMFGTNSLLENYARFAHPYDFYSMRYVFAGAEKLQSSTRQTWSEKFGVRVFEGYGTTETGPAISINTVMDNRAGSVGRLLPGMDYYLEAVEGVKEGGRLVVRGPNVMLGYFLPDRPGQLITPATERGQGWFDTGDIASVDEDGFITILERVKRLSRVAGEMISLTAVESFVNQVQPDRRHAVVAIPDTRKCEKLVLVTEDKELQREQLVQIVREQGIDEKMVPSRIRYMKKLPVLGSGKTDYVSLQEIIAQD